VAAISGPMIDEAIGISCAVEVFLATALLHRENPERQDFTIQEIVNRVARENLTGSLRSGINVHASQHCVANKAPNPAKHRMLFATGKHTRRLVLPNDELIRIGPARYFPTRMLCLTGIGLFCNGQKRDLRKFCSRLIFGLRMRRNALGN
jgi:hypothetical protein